MNESTADSIYVGLLCILRCVVPLLMLFGLSYLLRRLGLVAEQPEPPVEDEEKKMPQVQDEPAEGEVIK